jgi:hypothetical protein
MPNYCTTEAFARVFSWVLMSSSMWAEMCLLLSINYHAFDSLGLSATSQQYFSLRTNQPPATIQQYSSVRTNQHQPSVTSQPNRLTPPDCWLLWSKLGTVALVAGFSYLVENSICHTGQKICDAIKIDCNMCGLEGKEKAQASVEQIPLPQILSIQLTSRNLDSSRFQNERTIPRRTWMQLFIKTNGTLELMVLNGRDNSTVWQEFWFWISIAIS